jgi:hypothetical protein
MPSARPPAGRLLSIQETNMPGKILSSRVLLSALVAGITAGCSSMQPTPMMPTQPARIGDGVSAQQDSICRQQAYQAAQKAKESNIAKEVGITAVGALAGAVIGNALEPGRGPAPRGPGPGGPGGPAPRGPSGPQLGTAGGVTGAAVGAAASQGVVQNTQQVYDITYRNCIASYGRY